MPGTRVLSAALTVGLLLAVLSGCGGEAGKKQDGPSRAALACRAAWRKIGEEIAPQVDLTLPSALPRRWNTVAATVDYYRTTATGSDCGERVEQQKQAISSLKAFSARLTGYDMQAQLALLRLDAQAYAAGPWPPATGRKRPKVRPRPARPPRPALVGKALATLAAQAPVATQQQGPGWEQASVVDLADTAATAKAVRDLRFLSTESSGWRACQVALATIRAALAAKAG